MSLEVGHTDDVLRDVLVGHGFEVGDDVVVEAWLAADDRPPISALHEGYRLSNRVATIDRPHHMINAERGHPDPEPRLRETSLYRPDLDLVIHDSSGDVAAYGLFWYDPVSATGLVEPMRTEDAHQRRGLARHVLTTGIALLAEAGATRIKICFEPDNAASTGLYLDVGFAAASAHRRLFRPHRRRRSVTRAEPGQAGQPGRQLIAGGLTRAHRGQPRSSVRCTDATSTPSARTASARSSGSMSPIINLARRNRTIAPPAPAPPQVR